MFFELDSLLPVVKCARHVHFVGGVRPRDCHTSQRDARLARTLGCRTDHVKVWLPMSARASLSDQSGGIGCRV